MAKILWQKFCEKKLLWVFLRGDGGYAAILGGTESLKNLFSRTECLKGWEPLPIISQPGCLLMGGWLCVKTWLKGLKSELILSCLKQTKFLEHLSFIISINWFNHQISKLEINAMTTQTFWFVCNIYVTSFSSTS